MNTQKKFIGKHSSDYQYLWYAFLRVSPSYYLAHRVRVGEIDLATLSPSAIPGDFEQVLKVYDIFGDVYSLRHKEWVLKMKGRFFSSRQGEAQARIVAKYDRRRETPKQALAAEINQYFKSDWAEEGKPNFYLVAVPHSVKVNTALSQIKRAIHQAEQSGTIMLGEKHVFELASPRLQVRSLLNYYAVLLFNAGRPNATLWQIGAHAKLLLAAGDTVGLDAKPSKMNQIERKSLEQLAWRCKSKALNIAENAARGVFPSVNPVEHAMQESLLELQARLKWCREMDKKNPLPKRTAK